MDDADGTATILNFPRGGFAPPTGEVVLSPEHCDYRWVPLDELDEFAELAEWVRAVIDRAAAARIGS